MEYKIYKRPNGYQLFLVRKDGSEMWIATRDTEAEVKRLVEGGTK